MPQLKHNALFDQLGAILKADKKPDTLTIARLSRDCDALLKTHPVEAYVARMLVGVVKGERSEIVAFGKKASPLLASSQEPVVFMHNFLYALCSASINDEWDVTQYLRTMLASATNTEDRISVAAMAYNFGLADTAQAIISDLSSEGKFVNTTGLDVPAFNQIWTDIKLKTGMDERELSRLQGIAGEVYFRMLKRPIPKLSYDFDTEDGTLFSIFYAADDVQSDNLIDACWEIERVLESETSPLLDKVIFTIRHH